MRGARQRRHSDRRRPLEPARSMEMALHDESSASSGSTVRGRATTVTGSFIDLIQGDGFVEHWSEMSLPFSCKRSAWSRSTRSPGTCSFPSDGHPVSGRAAPALREKRASRPAIALVIWLDPGRTIPIATRRSLALRPLARSQCHDLDHGPHPLLVRDAYLAIRAATPPLPGTEHAYLHVLAARLLAIASKRKSAAPGHALLLRRPSGCDGTAPALGAGWIEAVASTSPTMPDRVAGGLSEQPRRYVPGVVPVLVRTGCDRSRWVSSRLQSVGCHVRDSGSRGGAAGCNRR